MTPGPEMLRNRMLYSFHQRIHIAEERRMLAVSEWQRSLDLKDLILLH
jgi:hypothetical protein